MDTHLEEWIDKKLDPVKESGLPENNVLGNISETLGAENSIEQMIGDIDNSDIRDILTYNLKENLRSREELKKEIMIYYEEIEKKLGDEDLKNLFNLLVTNRRILPSFIVKEFEYRDQILAESDPKVKELMEISLKHGKFPSLVLNGREFYNKFTKVEDKKSKDIILYYLEKGLSPRLVNDEYEDYLYIKNYEYKNTNLRDFIVPLIENKDMHVDDIPPSLVVFFFSIFKDWTEFEEDEDGHNPKKEYIISLLNTRGL